MPGAGRGLFGIRPCKGNPLLFKQANEFVCAYATMQGVITVTEAQATESAYVWTNSKNLHLDWDPAAQHDIRSEETNHQRQDPSPQRTSRRPPMVRHVCNYCEEEVYQCPLRYEQPYGKREGVAISESGLPGAGRGLFGIRPCKGNPLLFKQANEFVCVYATMRLSLIHI